MEVVPVDFYEICRGHPCFSNRFDVDIITAYEVFEFLSLISEELRVDEQHVRERTENMFLSSRFEGNLCIYLAHDLE